MVYIENIDLGSIGWSKNKLKLAVALMTAMMK